MVIVLLALMAPISAAPYDTTRTPIQHVVIVMMENHSFDNMFGTYPAVAGGTNSAITSQIQGVTNLLSVSKPPALTAVPDGTFSTPNPTEGYGPYHADWNNGRMDGFAANSGIQSMTYFTSSQLAVEWDWAEEYAMGNMYFATYLSETSPNRLMSLAAYTPVTNDEGPPPFIPVNQSIFAELSQLGVSWGYYVNNPSGVPYPLNYFSGIDMYSKNMGSETAFFQELSNGSLPSVSWVMPVGGGSSGISQHPSDNVTYGEMWLLDAVNHVMSSRYWNSTAIFVTYDEGGGYYDQVPPPTLDGVQFGFRVPLIVISPYAKENYVSNTVLNHASLLAFIDYNWNLPPLNKLVADSNIPLDLFDFSHAYSGGEALRQPLLLNGSSSFPIPPQIPFRELPYARSGSSNVTLASMNVSPYVRTNSSYTPPYESPAAAIAVGIALISLLIITGRVRKSKRVGRRAAASTMEEESKKQMVLGSESSVFSLTMLSRIASQV